MLKAKTGKKAVKSLSAIAVAVVMGASVFAGTGIVSAAEGDGTQTTTGNLTKYYSDYNSMEEAKKAAEDLTRQIVGEGASLLKNRENALPMKGSEWVSVFGVTSDNLIGASDSSGAFSSGSTGSDETLAAALEHAGFKVNPTLKNFYSNDTSEIGKEVTDFPGSVDSSTKLYNDAAFIVLSREGGEGSDASRVTGQTVDEDDDHAALYTDDKGNTYKHYLMLTDEEEELIEYVTSRFEKVIVITNTSNAMELEDLENNDKISAILHIGRPGVGGLAGVTDILTGLSPSGGLVDEWMADFTTDPTWYNFGSNNQTGDATVGNGAGSNSYRRENGAVVGSSDDWQKGDEVAADKITATTDDKGNTTYKDDQGNECVKDGDKYYLKADTYTSYDTEGYHGVDYEEGIYLGYKYYETVYTEIANGNLTYDAASGKLTENTYGEPKQTEATLNAAEAWWEDNVLYPYGYSLNYTTFSFNAGGIYTDEACSKALGATGLADMFASSVGKEAEVDKIYVPVTVKNTGSVAGKKTVQAYVSAPYYKGGVEKAAVTLCGFAKTDMLEPGEEQTIVIEINVQDMASWDYNDANTNQNQGCYEMDEGKYTIRLMEDSHYDFKTDVSDNTDAYDEVTFTLEKDAILRLDDYSGNELENLFSEENGSADGNTKIGDHDYNNVRTAEMMADGESGMSIISRANMVTTFPKAPTLADLTFQDEVLDNIGYWDNFRVTPTPEVSNSTGLEVPGTDTYEFGPSYDKESDPWYVSKNEIPAGWTQATGVYDEDHKVQNNRTETSNPMWVSQATADTIKFKDMAGVELYNADGTVNETWVKFMNQLTYDELCTLIEFAGYSTADIASVGKLKTEDSDGPNNWDSSHCWASADIIGATFNTELANKQGTIMGNLGLLLGRNGWYAPGADIHRSPFSGRNNEYYGQDGFANGTIAASVIQGVQSKGIICYVKHCFMNDQETNRGNLFTWCDEQAMRENYARSFQIALQEGESTAAMVGYGRLGGWSNTNNYNMNTELYQNQWGSMAYFVTDGYIGWKTRTDPDMMVRAGNVVELYTTPFVEYLSGEWDADKKMVVIDTVDQSTSKNVTVESPTQWYCVRNAAMKMLYQLSNTSAQFNGYSELTIAGSALAAGKQHVNYEASVAIDSKIDADSEVTYSVTSGSLPEGLTLDANTGKISGTPETTGEYKFTVEYMIDGWVDKTADYSIKIDDVVTIADGSDSLTDLKVGQDFYAMLESDEFNSDNYTSIEWTVATGSALPAGLELKTVDGTTTIEGTPTEAGTYTVTIHIKASKGESGGGGGFPGGPSGGGPSGFDISAYGFGPGGPSGGGDTSSATEVDIELVFVVAEADAPVVEAPDYVTGDEVQDMIDQAIEGLDKDSNTGDEGGCSGNLGSTFAVVGGSLALAAAAAVAVKCARRKNK